MTRDRLFGSDVPFMAWCRGSNLLPSWSSDCGWVQTDVDTFVHRYLTCIDGVGTREVQAMMEIEVKTRGGTLTDSQRDTYRKKHATIRPRAIWKGQVLANFGVSVVRLEGVRPDCSEWIKWCRFDRESSDSMIERDITIEQLFKLLRFDIHPDTLAPDPFRRHHKTRKVIESHKTEIGFEVEKEITFRS